jgi:hypothetical protein
MLRKSEVKILPFSNGNKYISVEGGAAGWLCV